MRLFDILRKKAGPAQPEKGPRAAEPEAPGWDAIEREAGRVYPGCEPLHYGTLVGWQFGGNDPLEGISVYDGGDYLHFVTFGLSGLYRNEPGDGDVSGYGMEFTLMLKKGPRETGDAEIKNICGILQSIARLTFAKGEIFRPFEYLYTGQTGGIDRAGKSALTGFITVPDPLLMPLSTPGGKVDFVEFVGVVDRELARLREGRVSVRRLYEKVGSLTDYSRGPLA